jgi:hypothetical protein
MSLNQLRDDELVRIIAVVLNRTTITTTAQHRAAKLVKHW